MEVGNSMECMCREKNLNAANLLTLLRIALLPAIVWRFVQEDWRGSLAIYITAMLTDVADGVIARRFNQTTMLGRLLDPLADKLSLLTMLSLFAAGGQIPMWVLYLVLIKELALIAGSAAALRWSVVVYALPVGKATTVTFALSIILRFLGRRMAADVLLGVSLGLSFVSLVWYTAACIRRIRDEVPCKVS